MRARSPGGLGLEHQRPIDLEPVAILEFLIPVSRRAEDADGRIRQVNAGKVRIAGSGCQGIADPRTLRERQRLDDGLLRLRQDDLDANWSAQDLA